MESLLSSAQATDLVGLLAVVSVQTHLGHEYREEADYWAGQVDPGLAADDAQIILAAVGRGGLAVAAGAGGEVGEILASSLEELSGSLATT